jgi:hypothetical protein
MADPWAEFRSPEANAASMVRNDESVTAPPRASVQPSRRVWGDAEAQAAGLYDTPGGDPWAAFRQQPTAQPQQRAPLRITVNPVASRFGEMQPPSTGAEGLQRGLDQRGLDLTRGPQFSPAAQMAGEMANLVPAASQGTTPHISNYGGQLVSTEAFEDDAGNVLYRDPQTKEVRPTNKDTQVAIRDPADGVVKVFNRSEATNEGPITGVARVLGPGLAAGAPTARAALGATPKALSPVASDTFSTAKPFYRAFDDAADKIDVPAGDASKIVSQIHDALERGKVPRHLADEVYKSVEEISRGVAPKELPYWQRVQAEMNGLETSTPGKPISLAHLRDVKELVGQSAKSADSRVRQASGIAAREINKIISQMSKSAGDNLKTADAIHATAKSQQKLQQQMEIAGLRTGRAGYGGNAVNNMRQVLSPIVEASIKGKTTGFKPNEISAMHEIINGTTATNRLREIGQLSPTKGSIATLGGIPTLGMTWVIGASANKLATILTARQVNRLNELVAKRSPAYRQALEKAVTKYERAQQEFISNTTPAKFAEYVAASRALSSGLTRDGVAITSGDLLRLIQTPMKGAAEGEEPSVPRRPGE